jgi:hypothetical protein
MSKGYLWTLGITLIILLIMVKNDDPNLTITSFMFPLLNFIAVQLDSKN